MNDDQPKIDQLKSNLFRYIFRGRTDIYARYWFAKGDLKTRTQILGALGSNLVIKDRNLLIDGQKHFFLIEKGKQEVEAMADKFGPEISLEMISKVGSMEPLRSAWLGDVDSDHGSQLQRLLSYR